MPTPPRRSASEEDLGVDDLRIFGGTSSDSLTNGVCDYLGMRRGHATISRFPDGETLVKLEDDVRGRDCFVVQSTCPPVNDNLMELLIFMDSLRRASARRITAVIPYYGYARQDRKAEGRTPITAKLVANMLVTAGADRVLTMNLHADQIQGFFDIPVDHLTAGPVLAAHCRRRGLDEAVFVSPDVGNVKFGNAFASRIGAELAVIHKRRLSGEKTQAVNLIGNVTGRTVIMFDDMISTAGTVCEAARLLRRHGAGPIYVGASHGLFAGPAVQRLRDADLTEIVVTDTVPVTPQVREGLPNLTVLSVSDLIGEGIRRIHEHRSVSALFEEQRRDHGAIED
jgi:ribose-phosphate pyrophosphokinase